MKEYIEPVVEVTLFTEDVVTASSINGDNDVNNSGINIGWNA